MCLNVTKIHTHTFINPANPKKFLRKSHKLHPLTPGDDRAHCNTRFGDRLIGAADFDDVAEGIRRGIPYIFRIFSTIFSRASAEITMAFPVPCG